MSHSSGITRRELLGRTTAGIVSLAGISLLDACGLGTAGTPGGPKGVLRVGLSGDFASMDPNHNFVVVAQSIYRAVWEKLVFVDTLDGAKLKPLLATSWKQVDLNTWEFTLRDGVKFSNGEPFNADSAVDSISRMMQDQQATYYTRLQTLSGVQALNAQTIRVTTKQPDVLTVQNVQEVLMYPKAYYASVGRNGFNDKPIGTGRYMLEKWDKGGTMTLVANPNYWGDKARVDRIEFRPIPEAATRVAALLAGEIDIAYNINPDDAEQIKKKGFVAPSVPNGQGTGIQYFPLHADAGPIKDKRVRQALNYAVDKDSIVKDIMLGYTRVLDGQVLGPDCFGYNPDLKPYPYDQAKAKQLLADAGYANGFSVNFESAAANYTKAQEVSENVVSQLAKVGVKANLKMLQWDVYVGKILQTLDSAPLTYSGWNYYPVMDANFAIQHFRTSSPFKVFSNSQMDALYDSETQEFDRTKREQIIKQFESVARDEATMLFLFQSPLIYGANPRVDGFRPTPDDHPHVETVGLKG